MFLHPKLIRPFATATERFANLPAIGTTTEVEQLFLAALAEAATAPGCTLQILKDHEAAEYRSNQEAVRDWLEELRQLDPEAPRRTSRAAQALRRQLAPKMSKLKFLATANYDRDELRLYPVVFGVEAVAYLVIATALEHESQVRVLRCDEKGCKHYVIQPGGRGKPRHHCLPHHEVRMKGDKRSKKR